MAALREYNALQENVKKAEAAKDDAAAALTVGLPAKVVAGTTVDFTLRVTNGTKRTLTVDPLG